MFQKESDCNVLAVCSGVDAILEALRRHQPDLLVLDLDRGGALTLLRRIQRGHLSTRVVVLASASDEREMSDALRLGARAVILKELAPEALIACIRKVHRAEESADPHSQQPLDARDIGRLDGRLVNRTPSVRNLARNLTPREAEIARLAVRGISTGDIATQLGLKRGTVKIHLHSIYEKLNVQGRVGLVLVGRRYGLV
jgi:two-component system, NarL family, nitrate/nitrite response regulator NarL